ncbi:HNH endonuclease [Fredinandcohnia salidurans]|uniref:HNH endonuclease n=1 Tax=Fredinandcohnia salidurans TaxID=2595041 RepID=A0ABW4MYW9_9BACI
MFTTSFFEKNELEKQKNFPVKYHHIIQHSLSENTKKQFNIVLYAKWWANGICQLCNQPAPYKNKKGEPHLHSHRIQWLSRGGEDRIANTIALCPNCHDRMHVLDDPKDVLILKSKVSSMKI